MGLTKGYSYLDHTVSISLYTEKTAHCKEKVKMIKKRIKKVIYFNPHQVLEKKNPH